MSVSIGAGTDIFVRKVQPGASVGVGYWIDVFQNGVKIDSFRVETKKKVVEIVKRYKEKYHTDRAFLNESQTHITYKTKEERGETAMQSLDQELHKKANTINIALQKLLTPLLPVKIREAEALGQEIINPQGINIIPETPGNEPAMSEDQIGPLLAGKFIEFVNKNQPQQGQEWVKSDDLYNPLKKWLTAIKKKINDYERMNTVQLDMNKISDIAEGIVFSGDPGKIKESTKIEVTPEVSAKVKEVASMKAGIRKKQSSDISGMVRVALEDPFDAELEKAIGEEENKNPSKESDEAIEGKEEFGGSEDTTYIGEIDIFKKEAPEEKEDIRSQILSFLSFSKNIKQAMELGRAISEWSNKSGTSLDIAKQVLSEISNNTDMYKEAFNPPTILEKDYFEIAVTSGFLGTENFIKLMKNIINALSAKERASDKEIDYIILSAFNSIGGEPGLVENAENAIKMVMERYLNNWMIQNKDIDYNTAKQGVTSFCNNAFSEVNSRYLYAYLSGGSSIVSRIKESLLLSKKDIVVRSTSYITGEIVRYLRSYVIKAFDNGSWVETYITKYSIINGAAKILKSKFDEVVQIESPTKKTPGSSQSFESPEA